MKKVILMLSAFLVTTVYADNVQPILNNVIYRVTTQAWVKTNTAKVIVVVNATVGNKKVASLRTEIMQKLQQLAANAKWNVTQFVRSQNPSGLEQVYLQAQARMPESDAANIRIKAKAASSDGQKIQVTNIDFTPSVQSVQQTYAKLREEIYRQANDELKRLNQVYPQQKYFLHQLSFDNAAPVYRRANLITSGAYIATNKQNKQPLTVARQITLTATVVLGAKVTH